MIINSHKPDNRIRFTIAHELGHILIPWHLGSIVDETDLDEDAVDDYWEIENEANRFASELLMPEAWMREQLETAPNPLKALSQVTSRATVSVQAALIKLLSMLPAGHIVAQLDDGFVAASKRSPGTLANQPPVGIQIDVDSMFPWTDRWQAEIAGRRYVWWEFPTVISAPIIRTNREWRDILDEIVADLSPPEPQQFKATLNGIIAYANGRVKENRRIESILNACLQRLHSKAVHNIYVSEFLAHDLFKEFLSARIHALLR